MHLQRKYNSSIKVKYGLPTDRPRCINTERQDDMKEIITEQAFRTQLEKSPVGGFLFFGEEDYLKAYALKQAKSIVSPDPSLAIFNDINVDCSTGGVNGDAFFAAVAAAPMMADVKLVTLNGLSVNDMKAEELDRFIDSLELLDEYDFNLLIVSVPSGMIDEGRLPKAPSSALKKLGERLTPVHFPRVPDAKLSSWIVRHFAHRGIAVREGIPAAILEYCGRNMYSLANDNLLDRKRNWIQRCILFEYTKQKYSFS